MRPYLFFGVGVILAGALRGEPVRFASGTNQTALIELFTSEGCSNCPLADHWLAALCEAPGLWRDFVPLAWHVDYWNRLGWPDRFAAREFTQREYRYAAAWSSDSVYTPCFVRNGVEWRGARPLTPDAAAAGQLVVDYDGHGIRAQFSPAHPRAGEHFVIYAALLGGGITSRVTAGENNGDTLHHEFVVLRLAQGPPGDKIPLPVPIVAGVTRHALAVWVTREEKLAPLQATGGWID